jgi:flavodoxin
MEKLNEIRRDPMKSLLIVYSYHHNNTEKIAEVIAKTINSVIKTPQQTNPTEGFGSGIDSDKH